jgi:hypothetical protein
VKIRRRNDAGACQAGEDRMQFHNAEGREEVTRSGFGQEGIDSRRADLER